MASAHTLPLAFDRGLRTGFFSIVDPGASGTLDFPNMGFAYCEVVTAAAETRALPTANGYPVGAELTVILKTDGGDLTITGADNGSAVLDTVGASAVFMCVDENGTKAWKRTDAPLGERLRATTDATSGTFEGIYTRLAFTGDGTATGEALRAFTNVNANIATAHGAHLSLSFSAEAGGSEASGLGAAMRATTQIPNIASWAPTGTLYGAMVELYSDGSASDPAGLTELAVLCLSNSGDATGKADVDTDASVISIQGFTAATGTTNAISSTSLTLDSAELRANVGIRVKIGSTVYYVPAFSDWQ